jgi:glycerol-3-phosphate dehydrogenase (NAD(P)+)
MSEIFIVGSGSFGTALAISLAASSHSVTLWSRSDKTTEYLKINHKNEKYLNNVEIPKSVRFTSDFRELSSADLIIMAVPSGAVAETAKKMSPHLRAGQDVINVAKGFEPLSNERLSKVLKRELPNAEISVLSGPSHAEEVAVMLPTTNVIANEDIEKAKRLQAVLSSESFRVYSSDDVIGVEMGGALKNVIAICTGVAEGYGFGDNTRAAIMTRGMSEIIRFGIALGAKFETFMGLSGFGDLIVTCTSIHSRNRRAGILIGKGKSAGEAQSELSMVVEGISASKAVYELAKRLNVDMPIVNAVYSVLFENNSIENCVCTLMNRPMKKENS